MTKEEYIKYWVQTANQDWKTVGNLLKTKDYVPSLFFAHLHLEKICKAIWISKNNGNHPPRIHNLVFLLNGAKIQYSPEQLDFMLIMNNFQLEGRYPDYKMKLYRIYKKSNTEVILSQVKELSKWLQKQL